MKFFWTVPFINPNTWDRLIQRILAQFVRPSNNSITITLKRLVALLEEDETDEYGILQPSQAAANIMGLPYKEDDLAQAERLAGLLAKKSQIVWKPKS